MDRYAPKKKLGGGAEGLVYLVEEKSTHQLYAIKMITVFEESNFEKIKREVELVKKFHEHSNIVRYYDHFEERSQDAFYGEELKLFMLMEYCDKGSLEEIIQKHLKQCTSPSTGRDEAADKHLPFPFILSTIKQCVSVLAYIHKQHIVHRDLKPANLLFKSPSSSSTSSSSSNNSSSSSTTTLNTHENYTEWTLKLSDFGFTKEMKDNMAQSFVGTLQYMSPELFSSKKYDAGTDIWSLGVCILRMFAFLEESQIPDFRHEIKRDPEYVCKLCRKYKAPKTVEEVTAACLTLDPTDRPTAVEILQFLEECEKNNGQPPSNVTLLKKLKPAISDSNYLDPNMDDDTSSQSSSSDLTPAVERIINEKAREFWKKHGWENKTNWLDFREAYINLIQQLNTLEKKAKEVKDLNGNNTTAEPENGSSSISYSGISLTDFLRGLKTAICSKHYDWVSISALNELTKQAGFPFNPDYVIGLTAYEVGDETEVNIDDTLMDTESFMKAQGRYLETILNCDKVFIDPISQEPLQIDQHMAPLELIESNEWNDLLKTESEAADEDPIKKNKTEKPGTKNRYYEDAVDFLSTATERPLKYLILGSAASGKTCMMKLLCYKAAQKAAKNSSDSNANDLIPLLVPLANISFDDDSIPFKIKCIRASADTFNKGLKYPSNVERFLLNVWQCGRLLLLLDGLDEGGDHRSKLEKLICKMNFRELGGIITTSRVSGFEQEEANVLFESFKLARIKPLSQNAQKQIAMRRGIKDPRFFQALQKYKELAKIPLLLSLMIQEFKQNKDLPDIRSVLYEHACETMISVYIDKVRPQTTKQERRDIFEMLYAVASILHEHTKRYFTSAFIEKHLHDIVNNEESGLTGNLGSNVSIMDSSKNVYETWKVFQSDIDDGHFPLIIRLGSHYSFAHLSFQEYLVAKVWSDPKRVSTIREQKKGLFGRRKEGSPIVFSSETKKLIVDPWYRETFLLCAGSMSSNDFSEFMTFLYENFKKSSAIDNLLLQMIRSERPIEERDQYSEIEKNITTQKKLKTMIMEGLIHDSPLLREMTTKRVALYENDLTNVVGYLLKVLTKNKDKTKQAASSLLDIFQQMKDEKEFKYRVVKRLIESLSDKQWKIGEQSVVVLLAIAEKDDPRITKKLWALITKPPIEVQVRACYVLSLLSKKGDSKFINKFMEILLSETIKEGRYMDKMIDSLVNICVKADEMILSQIRSNIKQAQNKLIRHGLIAALGRISNVGDMQSIKLLVQILSKEKSADTLAVVVDSLKMMCEKRDIPILTVAMKLLKDHIAYRPDKSLKEEYEEYELGFVELAQKIMELLQVLLLGREYLNSIHNTSQSKKDKRLSSSLKSLSEHLQKEPTFKKLMLDLIDTLFTLAVTVNLDVRKYAVLTMASFINHHDEEIISFVFEKIKEDLLKNIMNEDKSMEINTAIYVIGVVFAHSDNNQACNILLELLDSNSSNAFMLGEIFVAMGNVAPKDDLFMIEIISKHLEIEKDNHMQEKELWKLKARAVLALENIFPIYRDEKFCDKYIHKLLHLMDVCPSKYSHLFKFQCVKVLGKLAKKGDKDMIHRLSALATERDMFLRKAVAQVLGIISDKANKTVVRYLKDMLEDENADVRQEAIESLCKVADLEQLVTSLKANSSDLIRTSLFSVIIAQIRESRQENPKFCLTSKQAKHLESLNCTEARFILLENYSV
ncbi:hypothetical protein C9374_012500 [Naegleria lovaniensis]|uniref:non-specific serine/threonine protein kinase n=1 Tax=Naegleria lovaniensis TaxID=51637 RepID=A0AA88GZW8_NAELO|nr:uncharacterized protein C9374_012500 [Naegleria lovaniensis]KAG2392248.1 hypothetical protein C9374_012500 [Naegleria lovaniensis]